MRKVENLCVKQGNENEQARKSGQEFNKKELG